MSTVRPGPGGRPPGWQQAHAKRYLETGGRDGHDWEGVTTLLLTTTGRRSGQPRTTPLIYGRAGDRFLVVASRGGAPAHPDWYQNLVAQPEVYVQVMADRFHPLHGHAIPERCGAAVLHHDQPRVHRDVGAPVHREQIAMPVVHLRLPLARVGRPRLRLVGRAREDVGRVDLVERDERRR